MDPTFILLILICTWIIFVCIGFVFLIKVLQFRKLSNEYLKANQNLQDLYKEECDRISQKCKLAAQREIDDETIH